jgi:hypothetical protein
MPAPKWQRTGMAANELTSSTDLATGAQQLVRVSHRYIFRRAEEFQWRQSQRARRCGVLRVIGTEEHIPCGVRLTAWTPIHTKFSPLKAVWFQNRLAFDITAARPVTPIRSPLRPEM